MVPVMDESFAECSSKKLRTDKSNKDMAGQSVLQLSSKALLLEDSFDSDKWEKSDMWSKVTDESFLNMEIECGVHCVQVQNDTTLLNDVEEPSFFNNDWSQSISTSMLLPMEHVVIEGNASSYQPSMLNVFPKRKRIGFYDSLETDSQWSNSSSNNSVEQVSSSNVSKGLKVKDVVPIFSLIKNVSYRASALGVFPKRKRIVLEEDSQGSISSNSSKKCTKTDGFKNDLAGPNVIRSSSPKALLLEDSFHSNDREDLWSKVTDESFLNMEIECGVHSVQQNDTTLLNAVEEPSFFTLEDSFDSDKCEKSAYGAQVQNDSTFLYAVEEPSFFNNDWSQSMSTSMPMEHVVIEGNASSYRPSMSNVFPKRKRIGFYDSLETDSQWSNSSSNSVEQVSSSSVSKGLKVEDVLPIFSSIKYLSYRASSLSVFPTRKRIGFYDFLEEDSQGSKNSKSSKKCSKTDGSKNDLAVPNVIQTSSPNVLLLEDSFHSNDRDDLWSKVTDDSFLDMEIQCGIYEAQSNSTMIHAVEEQSLLNDSSLLSESIQTYMLSSMEQSTIQSVNSSSLINLSSHQLRTIRRRFVEDSQGYISNSSDDGTSLSNVSTYEI